MYEIFRDDTVYQINYLSHYAKSAAQIIVALFQIVRGYSFG